MTNSVKQVSASYGIRKFLGGAIRTELLPYIACFCTAALFCGLTLRDVYHQRRLERDKGIKQLLSRLIPVRASEILAGRTQFRGDPQAPFTLVEFGDYECPPCRATQRILASELDKCKGSVRLDFRQFPLANLHPHARDAAVAAESAYLAGKFWNVHDLLFAADLSKPGSISGCLAAGQVAADPKRSRRLAKSDASLATLLGVNGTPSFVLCCPDGRVFWVAEISDLGSYLNQYAELGCNPGQQGCSL